MMLLVSTNSMDGVLVVASVLMVVHTILKRLLLLAEAKQLDKAMIGCTC